MSKFKELTNIDEKLYTYLFNLIHVYFKFELMVNEIDYDKCSINNPEFSDVENPISELSISFIIELDDFKL